MHFEMYRDKKSENALVTLLTDQNRQWRWRLWSDNARIIADSGEGYHNEADCLAGIRLVQSTNSLTEIQIDRS